MVEQPEFNLELAGRLAQVDGLPLPKVQHYKHPGTVYQVTRINRILLDDDDRLSNMQLVEYELVGNPDNPFGRTMKNFLAQVEYEGKLVYRFEVVE